MESTAMPLDYQQIMDWRIPDVRRDYTSRDTILYALGIGASVDPFDTGDLKYLYEGDGFVALPTIATVLGQGPFWMADPALGLEWRKIVHAEQKLELHGPIPPSGTIISTESVEAIYDKGSEKGALVCTARALSDGDGNPIATVRSTAMLRGDGGFGGNPGPTLARHVLPADRAPDHIIDLPTRADQAMIYRLSGDTNPLHIDPSAAKMAGFTSPILHGLCAYGVVGRAIIRTLCDNDPARLHRLDVRFSSPVFPGDTIRTEVWRNGVTASFRARSIEQNRVVLDSGYAAVRS